jgi:hypothetical protein
VAQGPEELAFGIDLHPLGWKDLRDRFDVPEDIYFGEIVDPRLRMCLKVASETRPNGSSVEVMVLAAGEVFKEGRSLSHMFKVVDGVLTQATIMVTDPTIDIEVDQQQLTEAYEAERTAGMLIPSPDDALSLISFLGRMSGIHN